MAADTDGNDLAFIIPAYNEEGRIEGVVSDVNDAYPEGLVVVVDDGSDDNTAGVARREDCVVLEHIVNLGKGAALRTGSTYAKDRCETLIFFDGDGQHALDTVPSLLESLSSHSLVVACRDFDENMPLLMRIGNRVLTGLTKALFNVSVSDTQSGFRAVKASVLDKVMWETNHYAVETEMLVEAGRNDVSVGTVPTQTIYEDEQKGTDPLHGIKIALNIVYWRLSRWS